MKQLGKLTLAGFIAVGLVACSNLTKQDVGTVSGGALGGLVGSRFGGGSGRAVAIAAGAIVGGLVGGKIGKSMDQADQQRTAQVLESTPTQQTTTWKNPDSGNQYAVTPTHTTYQNNGQPCREYKTNATIDGQPKVIYGNACRQADGSWKVVN